jgi:arylsulfatase A-like enzyme
MMRPQVVLAVALASLILSGCGPQEESQRPPNVILILADDLGYADLSAHGNTKISTPNIDSLAASGARMTDAYASNAVCAPSRAGLMTGRYQQRFGFEFNPVSVRFAEALGTWEMAGELQPRFDEVAAADPPPPEEVGLEPDETTLAELLRANGYATAHIGKWHLGTGEKYDPRQHGFDTWYGFWSGATRFGPRNDPNLVETVVEDNPVDVFLAEYLSYDIVRNGEPVDETRYQTYAIAEETAAFISANRDRPFFVYAAFGAPHDPLQAPRDIYEELGHIEDEHMRVYQAMVVALDRGVGTILEALETAGVADDTMVLFSSDNGGALYLGLEGINDPLRGGKATFWEGGFRVPFFVKWPGHIPPGTVVNAPTSLLDVFPTVAEAAGAAAGGGKPLDGRTLLPVISDAAAGHEVLFWRSGDLRAVRRGDWKLISSADPPRIYLYDLSADPGEENDVSGERQEIVAELETLLAEHDTELEQPRWPALFEIPVYAELGKETPEDDYIYWAN